MIQKILIKVAIFFAAFFYYFCVNAQEYNNWIVPGGAIMNFNTSPATIKCNALDYEFLYTSFHVCLSDDNGNLILHGGVNNRDCYCIKDANGEILVKVNNFHPKNVIGCRLPHGKYCIAGVFKFFNSELHVYIFDSNGRLEYKYIYNDASYGVLLDFIRVDGFVALVAYSRGQIKTYKLTSEGCTLWNISEVLLDDHLMMKAITYYDIEHTLDNKKIIFAKSKIFFVLNFDKYSGKVTVDKFFNDYEFHIMSFSHTGKYFMTMDDKQIHAFKYDNDFDFNLENPNIVIDLPIDNVTENGRIKTLGRDMAIGEDDKLYVTREISNYQGNYLQKSLIVIDGIETGNITEEIIELGCLTTYSSYFFFPYIPKFAESICDANVEFDNSYVCHGQPLKMILNGNAPYEVSYTIDGIEKSIITNDKEYSMPDVAGKYTITKLKDASCEYEPIENNTSVIAPELLPIKIKAVD